MFASVILVMLETGNSLYIISEDLRFEEIEQYFSFKDKLFKYWFFPLDNFMP
jgi:hypothetical protein